MHAVAVLGDGTVIECGPQAQAGHQQGLLESISHTAPQILLATTWDIRPGTARQALAAPQSVHGVGLTVAEISIGMWMQRQS